NNTGGSSGENRSGGGATCFARGDAGFIRNDSWLPGDAEARRKIRAPRRTGILFCVNAYFCSAYFWKGFLSRSRRTALVFRVPFLFGIWRGEFCGVHTLAARAVSYGVPRQRVCVFYFARSLCGRGNHVSRWLRRTALRLPGHSRRVDFDCVR